MVEMSEMSKRKGIIVRKIGMSRKVSTKQGQNDHASIEILFISV